MRGVRTDPFASRLRPCGVVGIGDDLAAKPAAVGLNPERPKAVTLAGLLALYAAEKEAGNRPERDDLQAQTGSDATGQKTTEAADPVRGGSPPRAH